MQKVIYPGSFDPLTFGHLDIIERLSRQFDEVVVLISWSSRKKYILDIIERKTAVTKVCQKFSNVRVDAFEGLLVEYVKKNNINMIAKGLRNARDYEYEMTMDHMNKTLFPDVETLYLISRPELSFISSTLVKEIASLGGDLKKFVPSEVEAYIKKKDKK